MSHLLDTLPFYEASEALQGSCERWQSDSLPGGKEVFLDTFARNAQGIIDYCCHVCCQTRLSEAVCKDTPPICILRGILERSESKQRGEPNGKSSDTCRHASARGRGVRPDAKGTASLAPKAVGDYLSSVDRPTQSRGHCQNSGCVGLNRSPGHGRLQPRRSGCHRDTWQRWAASSVPHAGTRTRLAPAVRGPRRSGRDRDGRRDPSAS